MLRLGSAGDPMPQEISVSYQAIKSKVYRLIDALVVGEKTESEIQESTAISILIGPKHCT